jgi:hypothetical protein
VAEDFQTVSLRPSEKSRRASCWSLRTRQNGSKKLYFGAEYLLNRGATDYYSRPFSDGLSRHSGE